MASLNDLSREELLQRAVSLGLRPPDDLPEDRLRDRVRERQGWIERLDETVLGELVEWAGVRGARYKPKDQLAREVCFSEKDDFAPLSRPALLALATLRGVEVDPESDAETLRRTLGERKGAGGWLRTVWEVLKKDAKALAQSPKKIKQHGVVGGLGSTLLGAAADSYIQEKLDEIEDRIDRKLDEIDKSLEQWRDREVANRLRILRITLLVSLIIALVSLGYAWLYRLITTM